MGSIPAELSLDLRPTYVPKSISDFLKEISPIGDVSQKAEKLGDFIKRLEDEMRKIEAFKRELPLCMLLLKDAIQFLKEEPMQCTASNAQPVLEEFIPLKTDQIEDSGINKENDCVRDKMNWMSSVQLWKTDEYGTTDSNQKPDSAKQIKQACSQRNEKENRPTSDDLSQSCKTLAGGRAFMPFKAYPSLPTVAERKEAKEDLPVSGLSLLTPGTKTPRGQSGSSGLSSKSGCTRAVSSSVPNSRSDLQSLSHPVPPQQQASRKQRRCWSPELHRRFVNALQQLGGSQVATPKQIRELMQVDGLTNDEVKSHLQKYRLHTRRLPTAASSIPANQPVVLGGLWMPQDQYGDSSKLSNSQSGSPQGPLQLTGNTGGTSTTGSDSMEDEEDEKSESYSWKSRIHKHG